MAMAAEPAPQIERQQIVRSPAVDAAGNRVVDHGEGW
jgi:hypothetical protein